MEIYKFLSGVCFFACIANIIFLWYLSSEYEMPHYVGRTHYVFFVTQFISIVIQYATYVHPQPQWILKALSIAVWADAFSFCMGIYNHGLKKIKSK